MRKLKNKKVKEEKVEEKKVESTTENGVRAFGKLDYIFYALFAVMAFLSNEQFVLVRTMGLIVIVVVILHFFVKKVITRTFVYRILGFFGISILSLLLHKAIELFS